MSAGLGLLTTVVQLWTPIYPHILWGHFVTFFNYFAHKRKMPFFPPVLCPASWLYCDSDSATGDSFIHLRTVDLWVWTLTKIGPKKNPCLGTQKRKEIILLECAENFPVTFLFFFFLMSLVLSGQKHVSLLFQNTHLRTRNSVLVVPSYLIPLMLLNTQVAHFIPVEVCEEREKVKLN